MARTITTTTSPDMITVEETPVKIAVMNNDIKHITETLNRMENKFDTAIANFVTSDQLSAQMVIWNEKHKEQDNKISNLLVSVAKLTSTDDTQQGAIDASRRFTAIGLAIVTIAVAALTTYLGLHK